VKCIDTKNINNKGRVNVRQTIKQYYDAYKQLVDLKIQF